MHDLTKDYNRQYYRRRAYAKMRYRMRMIRFGLCRQLLKICFRLDPELMYRLTGARAYHGKIDFDYWHNRVLDHLDKKYGYG